MTASQSQNSVSPRQLNDLRLALAVDPRLALIPLFTGCGLLAAGLTGRCGMILLLAKMPWNRIPASDDRSCCQSAESQKGSTV